MFYVTGQILRETPKAILLSKSRVNTDGGDIEAWLPKSQIEGYEWERGKHKEIYIIVPEWLLSAKGMDFNECDHPIFGLPASPDEMVRIF